MVRTCGNSDCNDCAASVKRFYWRINTGNLQLASLFVYLPVAVSEAGVKLCCVFHLLSCSVVLLALVCAVPWTWYIRQCLCVAHFHFWFSDFVI